MCLTSQIPLILVTNYLERLSSIQSILVYFDLKVIAFQLDFLILGGNLLSLRPDVCLANPFAKADLNSCFQLRDIFLFDLILARRRILLWWPQQYRFSSDNLAKQLVMIQALLQAEDSSLKNCFLYYRDVGHVHHFFEYLFKYRSSYHFFLPS